MFTQWCRFKEVIYVFNLRLANIQLDMDELDDLDYLDELDNSLHDRPGRPIRPGRPCPIVLQKV